MRMRGWECLLLVFVLQNTYIMNIRDSKHNSSRLIGLTFVIVCFCFYTHLGESTKLNDFYDGRQLEIAVWPPNTEVWTTKNQNWQPTWEYFISNYSMIGQHWNFIGKSGVYKHKKLKENVVNLASACNNDRHWKWQDLWSSVTVIQHHLDTFIELAVV